MLLSGGFCEVRVKTLTEALTEAAPASMAVKTPPYILHVGGSLVDERR